MFRPVIRPAIALRPLRSALPHISPPLPLLSLRLNSLDTPSSRSFTSAAQPNDDRLTWDEFLRLRKQRRITGILASIPASAAGVYTGLSYFGSGEIDPMQTILGFDPFLMNAAFVLGCGVFGWLVGPTIGRGAWHLLHRKQTHLISLKEGQFYKHIEKNRADPSFQSYSNPVPDYYGIFPWRRPLTVLGEKIGSLKDYRRWLKDQKAYKKKAQTFL